MRQKSFSYKHVSSIEISTAWIYLSFGSITTQSHISSEPAFIAVSSTMNSMILLFLQYFFVGLYFCNQFQIETWLILTKSKKDNALAVFLNDNPKKYKY